MVMITFIMMEMIITMMMMMMMMTGTEAMTMLLMKMCHRVAVFNLDDLGGVKTG